MDKIDFIKNLISIQENLGKIMENNEMQTRWLLIDPIITDVWGIERNNVIVEFPFKSKDVSFNERADYVIMAGNKPSIIVEAKSFRTDLWCYKNQLAGYFKKMIKRYDYSDKELIGVLTDGDTYLFFTNDGFNKKMYENPIASIRISNASDEKLYDFCSVKSFCDKNINSCEYDFGELYRIDEAYLAISSFENYGINYEIEKMYICGKPLKISSLKNLYSRFLNEFKDIKPKFLYNLAKEEDANEKDISNKFFSLDKNSSSQIVIKDNNCDVFVSIPTSKAMLIKRILYIVENGNIGIHNVAVKFSH